MPATGCDGGPWRHWECSAPTGRAGRSPRCFTTLDPGVREAALQALLRLGWDAVNPIARDLGQGQQRPELRAAAHVLGASR